MTTDFCARSGKISYSNKNQAQKAIGESRDRGFAKVSLKSYRCPYCGQLHLTKVTHPRKKVTPTARGEQ